MTEDTIRTTIQSVLEATNQFDQGAVMLTGLPEDYGQGASEPYACAIEPSGTSEVDNLGDDTSGGITYTCTLNLTFMYRNEDPIARDKGVGLLLITAQNAMNGAAMIGSLPDLIPGLTRFKSWSWQRPQSTERRIKAVFQVTYEIDGWNDLPTS